MKNKNKKLTHNEFEKNFDSSLFESKFVYLQGHHLPDKDWVEATNAEEGQDAALSVVDKFDERYRPDLIPNSENNIDSVVFGVRRSLMQGPLAPLNAEGILNERITNRLEYVRRNAPEFYKHFIDEQVRARIPANPGAIGSIWNAVSFRRWRVENNVAREFFQYNIRAGQNYMTLLNGIVPQIQALGVVMINGTPVNFASVDAAGNPNTVTTFDITVGPGGAPANQQVIVEWYEDDYITIKKKLVKAGVWDEFMGLPQGRDFMLLKFRYSLLNRVNNEEKAKLSNDRFRPQRLQTFLDNEAMTQALQDQGFIDWVNANSSTPPAVAGPNDLDFYADAEALRNGNIDLYNQLLRQQDLAKQRVQRNTLEQMLKDILTPNQLEQLHKSDEVKAMLAYLQAEINDPQEGSRVREFISNMAGRGENIDELDELVQDLGSAETDLSGLLTDYPQLIGEYNLTRSTIERNNTRISALGALRTSNASERERLEKANTELEKKLNELAQKLMNMVWGFREFIRNNTTNPAFRTIINRMRTSPLRRNAAGNHILNEPWLTSRPTDPANISNFLDAFDEFFGVPKFRDDVKELFDAAKVAKSAAENQLTAAKEHEGKAEKMDARGLLYRLVERDLRAKGVTEQNGIQQKALYATNILIAKSRNTDIYGQTNKQVAHNLERSWLWRHFRNDASVVLPDGVLPVLSVKDILSHLVSEPGFQMFTNLNVFSSLKDLRKMMQRYGMADPRKLREMQEKIGMFISGIEVPTEGKGIASAVRSTRERIADTLHIEEFINRYSKRKPVYGKKYTVRAEEAPLLENMMHQFALLEAELSSKRVLNTLEEEVQDTVEKGEVPNRSQLILKQLQEQTSRSMEDDAAIATAVNSPHAHVRKNLFFQNLRRGYYEVAPDAEEIKDKDEREEYLAKEGYPPPVRRRGLFSLRTRWFFRKNAKRAVTLPFKAIAVGFRGVKNFVKWGYNKLYNADTWKRSSEVTKEQWKSIFRTPFTVAGAVLVNYPTKILSYIPRMLDKSAVKSTDKSYAKMNRDVITT